MIRSQWFPNLQEQRRAVQQTGGLWGPQQGREGMNDAWLHHFPRRPGCMRWLSNWTDTEETLSGHLRRTVGEMCRYTKPAYCCRKQTACVCMGCMCGCVGVCVPVAANMHKVSCRGRVCTSNHKPQKDSLNTPVPYTQLTLWHHHGMLRAADSGSRPECCSWLEGSG